MEEEQTFINFDPNDFIIRISPVMEEGEWNGDITVGQVTTDLNNLSDHDYTHLSILTDMLVSAIPLMELDNEFRQKLYKLAQEQFGEDDKPLITERKGNVVKVNFK
jgi:hypothetical protein|tara:strand:+ start:337 stop:654 length:318 start_codon:yes stop_codon:yes gene_type:complete